MKNQHGLHARKRNIYCEIILAKLYAPDYGREEPIYTVKKHTYTRQVQVLQLSLSYVCIKLMASECFVSLKFEVHQIILQKIVFYLAEEEHHFQ
jgi:hypothetical protein